MKTAARLFTITIAAIALALGAAAWTASTSASTKGDRLPGPGLVCAFSDYATGDCI